MSCTGSSTLRRILTAACLFIPLVASANPVMLNPWSLIAFYVVAFWSFVVEAGVVALLLTFSGIAPLHVFIAYFVANAAVFFFLFQPLLEGSSSPPVLVLEALVVLIDGGAGQPVSLPRHFQPTLRRRTPFSDHLRIVQHGRR